MLCMAVRIVVQISGHQGSIPTDILSSALRFVAPILSPLCRFQCLHFKDFYTVQSTTVQGQPQRHSSAYSKAGT